MISEVSGVKSDVLVVKSIPPQAFYRLKWRSSKTHKNIVNHKAKTMSRFYSKNTVNVNFQGSKELNNYVLGVQTHTDLGFLSIQMKVVENTQKTRK